MHSLESEKRDQLISGKLCAGSSVEDNSFRRQVMDSLLLNAEMEMHARQLADEVARSNANAELVEESSNKFSANLREIKDMGGNLNAADRLSKTLSRRRLADCALFTLVFLFFYLTCAYILLKRFYFFRIFSFS